MNSTLEQVSVDGVNGDRGNWGYRGWLTGLALALLVLLFWSTVLSMVSIWYRSETFAHGFLIAPISIWLVWRKREQLAQFTPVGNFLGLPILLMLGCGWLLANLAEVQVVQQLTFVAMIPVMVGSLLGWHIVRTILFPLGFLLFMVPVGEGLIPPMMDFTATFSVHALRLTGLPVYWEGTHFSIPSGDWSVVEGCSGVRYLIASVTMGTLYAYLSYRSYWRRAVFVLLAIVVPIIANGMRAYMIVMIAHLSDMKLAMGVDHLIYGWVFFGFVMLILFWIGSLWSEPEAPFESSGAAVASGRKRPRSTVVVFAASLVAVAVWPAAAYQLRSDTPEAGGVIAEPVIRPAARAPWISDSQDWVDWKPRYVNFDRELQTSFVDGAERVGIYLAYYERQRQDAELVNSQNVMIPQKHPQWRQLDEEQVTIELGSQPAQVRQAWLGSANQKLLIWHWYWINGTHTSNRYYGKLLEARDRLLGRPQRSVGVVVYTEYDHRNDGSAQVLQRFLDTMLPSIEASLAAGERT